MTARTSAPPGAPCWADLWTSDVEGSVKFYSELLGWHGEEPSAEFGGYFMFTRQGVPVAGGMGDMGDAKANDSWKVYLATNDVTRTLEAARAKGAEIAVPGAPVADLGVQAVLTDPTGATVGAWQPKEFPGFTVLGEHGAPSWFELLTRDFSSAVAFYEHAFGWVTDSVSDTDEFRYSVMRDPGGGEPLAGIMDASSFLEDGVPSHWTIYFDVDDVNVATARASELGGSVVTEPRETPYGRLSAVKDPAGAQLNLRTAPGGGG